MLLEPNKLIVDYQKLSEEFSIPIYKIKAIEEVEGSGLGYDPKTGRILIQFEPNWFKKYTKILIPNGVDIQSIEYKAFSKAFWKNPDAAMKSTSWGSMQVMGFHYESFGFKCVGDFVDYMKQGRENQIRAGLMFIRSNEKLYQALLDGNYKVFARIYNGKFYYFRKYDKKLEVADEKYIVLFPPGKQAA